MKQYLDLMRLVRETGKFKADRTGTGTYSIFGHQMRFDLSEGFPLVTTKKCHLKSIIHELLWFLQGDSNIRYLKANGVSIWDEWIKEGTAEFVDLTVDELQTEIKKKLGVTSFGWNRADDDNIDSTWDPIGEIKHATFTIGKEDYDRLNVGSGPLLPIMQFTAESLDIQTKRLVAGELGPVYGTQWRSWPTMKRVHREVNMTIYERCVEANQHDDYFVLLGKAYAQQGDARAKALRELSDTFDRLGVPSVRRVKDVETGGIDQIAKLVQQLTNNPDSRRLIVSAWNPEEVDEMALPPCHALFQFYTSEMTVEERIQIAYDRGLIISKESMEGMSQGVAHVGLDTRGVPRRKLDCQLYQRSCDLFLGVPFNIASYALLVMMLAQTNNMVPGEFVWTGGDIHIYSNHLEQVDLQLSRTPHALPKMVIKQRGQGIDDFVYDDFELVDYIHDAAISAPIAV